MSKKQNQSCHISDAIFLLNCCYLGYHYSNFKTEKVQKNDIIIKVITERIINPGTSKHHQRCHQKLVLFLQSLDDLKKHIKIRKLNEYAIIKFLRKTQIGEQRPI